MKKLLLLCGCSLVALAQGDHTQEHYRGYNYISIGVEHADYQEEITLSSGQHVTTSAKANSPVYISGSLIRINKTFDFSIDISSTLLPNQIDEKWYLDGTLAQQNQFDALITNMQFLAHYKITQHHRILGGAMYKLNSFKRYDFRDENGNVILDSTTGAKLGLIEERVATLYAALGYGYESAPFALKDGFRFKGDLVLAHAIWNEATNTGFSKVSFDSIDSYKVVASAYVGYTVFENVELGCFFNYTREKKNGVDIASDGHTKWPENRLDLYQSGLSVVWNFSKE